MSLPRFSRSVLGTVVVFLWLPAATQAQQQRDDGQRRANEQDQRWQDDWAEWLRLNEVYGRRPIDPRRERRELRWVERHPAWTSSTQQWGWQRPLLGEWDQPEDWPDVPDWQLRARDWDPRGGDWRGVPWRARTRGWDPRRGDWQGPPPIEHQRNPVRVQGQLMHGVAAIGAETTGTELHFNGTRWELDFSQAPHLLHVAPRWNRQSVIAEGVVRTVRGVEIPQRTIMTVHSMRPAAYRFERR